MTMTILWCLYVQDVTNINTHKVHDKTIQVFAFICSSFTVHRAWELLLQKFCPQILIYQFLPATVRIERVLVFGGFACISNVYACAVFQKCLKLNEGTSGAPSALVLGAQFHGGAATADAWRISWFTLRFNEAARWNRRSWNGIQRSRHLLQQDKTLFARELPAKEDSLNGGVFAFSPDLYKHALLFLGYYTSPKIEVFFFSCFVEPVFLRSKRPKTFEYR